jgi:hypothetical protein
MFDDREPAGKTDDAVFAPLDKNGCACFAGTPFDCLCTTKERCTRWVAMGKGTLNPEQRQLLIDDTMYCAEGAASRSELTEMTDAQLAKENLHAMQDYVNSQL